MISSLKKTKFSLSILGILIITFLTSIACISETYNFEPDKPIHVINPFGWDVSAKCSLTTIDESDLLSGKIIQGNGKINGRDVGTGMDLEIRSGDSFNIDASPEAIVQITNSGKSTVIAECLIGNFANELDTLKDF